MKSKPIYYLTRSYRWLIQYSAARRRFGLKTQMHIYQSMVKYGVMNGRLKLVDNGQARSVLARTIRRIRNGQPLTP